MISSNQSQRDLRQRARADDRFLENALLEVQRLWPPFFGGRRLATKDVSLDKYKIPKVSYALRETFE